MKRFFTGLLTFPAGEDELDDFRKSFVSVLRRIAPPLHRKNADTEKERAHNQEIMRFRSELQSMFDAMTDAVLLIDKNMRIVQSNPRVYALLPQVEQVGGFIKPDCLRKDCCPFQGIEEVLKTGKMKATQCTIKLPANDMRHLHSICAPIIEDGTVISVVVVIRDVTEQVKTERELEEKTAELIAANRLLSRMAVTDSLTKIHNRRYFDEVLYKEIKRFNRHKYSHLSLMMIDIDHFKELNDRYGHLAGDMVLREIAVMLRENIRETDTVARYGGEEFVIVMPDTHLDGAAFRAEALRKRIENRVFPGLDEPITATISIGVATYVSGSSQELIKTADKALYRAKKAGRNNVAVSRHETVVKE